jgi:RNA polymerase sigma-70 factor (ECF subfamily)
MEPLRDRDRVISEMARLPFVDLPQARSKRFEALVRPHVLVLYRFAYRLLRNRPDAEDLVQDVLAKLYSRTNEMDQVHDLKPWLMRVVYHQFVDVIRRRSRRPVTLSEANYLELVDPALEPEHHAEVAQISERVRVAVRRLRRDQQLLVGLHLVSQAVVAKHQVVVRLQIFRVDCQNCL